MSEPRRSEFFDCGCGTQEHMIRFDMDTWSHDAPELFVSIYLNQYRPWWKRVIPAFKYLLNLKPARCGFGHWDTWIMQYRDIPRLQALLSDFQRERDAWADSIIEKRAV